MTLLKTTDYCPFDLHFADPEESELVKKIENIKNNEWVTLKKSLSPVWSSVSRVPASLDDTVLSEHETLRQLDQISVSGSPAKYYLAILISL